LPYLAVGLGLFWFRSAWVALVGFHLAIVLSLLLAKPNLPIRILFKSSDVRPVVLSILLCSSSGISLYFFWYGFGITGDLSVHVQSLGLNSTNWIAFIAYFALVNPWIEEYFWRGYLGSAAKSLSVSDFAYAGFHAMILWQRVQMSSIVSSLGVLIFAGWFWRQLAREDRGLLASVLGHMAADLTILIVVYRMTL
jgi:hypothetical protein